VSGFGDRIVKEALELRNIRPSFQSLLTSDFVAFGSFDMLVWFPFFESLSLMLWGSFTAKHITRIYTPFLIAKLKAGYLNAFR
jgi:hypothetical protein